MCGWNVTHTRIAFLRRSVSLPSPTRRIGIRGTEAISYRKISHRDKHVAREHRVIIVSSGSCLVINFPIDPSMLVIYWRNLVTCVCARVWYLKGAKKRRAAHRSSSCCQSDVCRHFLPPVRSAFPRERCQGMNRYRRFDLGECTVGSSFYNSTLDWSSCWHGLAPKGLARQREA